MDLNQFGVDDMRGIDKSSFFKFDKLYFPMIARFLFMALAAVILLSGAVGVMVSLVSMFTAGFLSGLFGIAASAAYAVVAVFFVRIWFELILVVFNINDALQEIKVNLRK
ncbi:MAG: DUF4282 domain-containing protein [Planctomycetota bacterium]|jgi:hypothetical protein|nr:DUF4282 domain-containing protein [Planctomycetota bacterium]